MIVVAAVAIIVVMASAGTVLVHDADVPPTNLPPKLYEILRQVTFRTPPSDHDLVSMALTCKEARSLVHHQLGRCDVRRLFFPEFGSMRFVKSLDHLPWDAADDSPEIQLLQQFATESNQVVLARKLFYLIQCSSGDLDQSQMGERSGEPLKTAAKTIRFLSLRCGYRSLPGYVLGICLDFRGLKYLLDDLRKLTSLLDFMNESSPIHEMFVSQTSSSDLFSDRPDEIHSAILKAIPEPFHPYLDRDRDGILSHLRVPPSREILQDSPGIMRALFKVGFTLDLLDILDWPDLTVTELRQMAPYLSMVGIGRFVGYKIGQKQPDLVVELLRHLPAVCESQRWFTHQTLFQSCVLSVRCGARDVLRGLLHNPMTIHWVDEEQFTNFDRPCPVEEEDSEYLLYLLDYYCCEGGRGESEPDQRPAEHCREQFLLDRDRVMTALQLERAPRSASWEQEGFSRTPTLQWMDSWTFDSNTA